MVNFIQKLSLVAALTLCADAFGFAAASAQGVTSAAARHAKLALSTKSVKKIGARMPDGSIYAGISPDTHRPLYALPRDESMGDQPMKMHWHIAKRIAEKKNVLGHHDWRLPSAGELRMLFKNRAAIGGFNTSGDYPGGWYWSSSKGRYGNAIGQHFSTGFQGDDYPMGASSVRLVR